ncbi:recombinase family protein [Deinococcus maricopensis]|uniref:Resolvase domain protein n=1 Tax=Deinococcus maricopensis (strain DSM 21211 / LMG 22137 / NRRL B-23946 / LB-34) TaxID=709986 RepID=E8U5T2_DEIML|nr:recombinase family protein [Deinococcus maricopensis]ADV66421.1 Resolvase domain protein [Deinococcus maricopensis DSM 21211]
MTTKAIAYFRVSREKQAQSGLGLEAQAAAVTAFVQQRGYDVVAEYTEVETGTSRKRRIAIHRAIEHAKREGAVLLIAKLDRLSRNLHFVSGLMESGVRFTAVDMPEANHLSIQIMAVMAEQEARAISTRTREALTAAKARGVKLGSPKPMTEMVRAKGREAVSQAFREAYRREYGYISLMRKSGMSLRAIAARLNQEGLRTRSGSEWTAVQVSRILNKFAA